MIAVLFTASAALVAISAVMLLEARRLRRPFWHPVADMEVDNG